MTDEFSLSDIQDAEYLSRERRELQELPETFYTEARRYTDALDAERRRETAEQALQTLAEQRYEKLRERATLGVSVDERVLTDEETHIYEKLQNGGVDSETAVSMLTEVEESNDDVELSEVRMLQDIPGILGVDGREYPPLQEEDVINLPRPNAEALVEKDAAKPVRGQGDEKTTEMSEGLAKAMGASD